MRQLIRTVIRERWQPLRNDNSNTIHVTIPQLRRISSRHVEFCCRMTFNRIWLCVMRQQNVTKTFWSDNRTETETVIHFSVVHSVSVVASYVIKNNEPKMPSSDLQGIHLFKLAQLPVQISRHWPPTKHTALRIHSSTFRFARILLTDENREL